MRFQKQINQNQCHSSAIKEKLEKTRLNKNIIKLTESYRILITMPEAVRAQIFKKTKKMLGITR